MKKVTITILICLIAVSNFSAQSRERIIEQLKSLKDQARKLEESLISPDRSDIERAKTENLNVFRILPREKYDKDSPMIRGGGAYYSFTTKSHSYDKTPQIQLAGNQFGVGFAGADYGYILDLGDTSLSGLTEENEALNYLLNYKPPILEPEIRIEQRKSHASETNGIKLQNRIPAVVGHSYLLRSISFSEADILVAFSVIRKDDDGSLILLWKTIKDFEKPLLIYQTDADLTEKINKILESNGLGGTYFEVKDGIVSVSEKLGRSGDVMNLIQNLRPNGMRYLPRER